MQSLVDKAIGVLEKNLDDGNCAAAVQVLKLVDMKPKEQATDVEVVAKEIAERITTTQLYDVVPFAVKPWTQNTQMERLAQDIVHALRNHYRIESGQLEELQEMLESDQSKDKSKRGGYIK